MARPAIVDTRNLLDPAEVRAAGLPVSGYGPVLMRVLVAGGAGFIGASLCARLLDRGDEVVCVDNLVTGSADNVKALAASGGVLLRRGRCQHCPSRCDGRFDAIVNLACPGLARRLRPAGPGDPGGREPGRRQSAGRWPAPTRPASSRRRRARCTASRSSIRSRRPTGATSTRSGPLGLRRGQALRRGPHHGLPPPARARGSAWPGSSTPTDPGCAPTTAG